MLMVVNLSKLNLSKLRLPSIKRNNLYSVAAIPAFELGGLANIGDAIEVGLGNSSVVNYIINGGALPTILITLLVLYVALTIIGQQILKYSKRNPHKNESVSWIVTAIGFLVMFIIALL